MAHLLLFGMMTVGLRHHAARPPLWLRLAALAGLTSVAVALAFQVVPLVDVVNRWDFALKVGGLLAAANLLGAALYGLGARRLARVSANPAAQPF